MKRRKALKQIGLGLSGGLLMPSLLDACSSNDPGPEISFNGNIAIIGAGAAGLYAADILRSKGVSVALFEARNQIGGRVCSLRNQSAEKYPFLPQLSSDFPIELGAQTITGSNSILGKIYKDFNLTAIELTPANNTFVLGNVAKTEADWNGDADFSAAVAFRNSIRSLAGSALTVKDAALAAGGNSRNLGMINGQISNVHGSNNEKIGVGALGEDIVVNPTDGKVLMLRSNPMQDILISRFSAVQPLVNLNTPITQINYSSDDKVVLTTKSGSTFEFSKVIVTVPVSILKNGSLTFTPALPATFSNSLAKIGMGASMRVLLEFKKNFWGNGTGFVWGSDNVPEYLNAGLGSTANLTLTITVNGDKAAQYSSMNDSAIVDAIVADLDQIYSNQATQFIRRDVNTLKIIYIKEDWTTRDYILGGYSYPMAGAKNADRKAIGAPVGNNLFFAGEATDISGQAGMVNGALASAERVVEEVVKTILKQA